MLHVTRSVYLLGFMVPLTACSFDFSSFRGSGSGGASNAGTEASTSTATTGHGSSSSATSSESASTGFASGAGGAATELARCGGVTDTFGGFDTSTWDSIGSVSVEDNHLEIAIDSTNGLVAQASLKIASQLDECYATIVVSDYESSSLASLLIQESPLVFDGIGYDQSTARLIANGAAPFDPGNPPDALGLVLHAGRVYFLYHFTGMWTLASSVTRPTWMDNGPNDTIAIVVGPGQTGETAAFDDFNVNPISVTDLRGP